jgi:hypothetical protein
MTIRRTHRRDDRPEPVVYQFLDSAGVAINLTGYTATTRWMGSDNVVKTGTATVVTPLSGLVTWTWPPAIFDQVWRVGANAIVTNGTLTFASDDFVLSVRPGAGG